MKAHLMHPDRNFDPPSLPTWHERALIEDLGLETLFEVMSHGDAFLRDVARRALLGAFENDLETIRHRQAVLRDVLEHPLVVRRLYDLATEAFDRKQQSWFTIFSRGTSGNLRGAVDVVARLTGILEKLRNVARTDGGQFSSVGFTALFSMLDRELSDAYLAQIRGHLEALHFRKGIVMGAALGPGNRGCGYVLQAPEEGHPWLAWLKGGVGYTIQIPEGDEAGMQALSELEDRGLEDVAKVMDESARHILGFFSMLRTELAFYVGSLNLCERLAEKGEPVAFPGLGCEEAHQFTGLYDPCLSLSMPGRLVGNAADFRSRRLVLVTGANQGGKSSFLRAIGLAQLMMQCGMFVAAETLEGALQTALFTHFRREEDREMKRGKLDEELARMSEIVDHLAPGAVVLCNESFAATNESEGSEIARQVVTALVDRGIRVFFVTHLYDFAHSMRGRGGNDTLFLRAQRAENGRRTFRMVEGAPLDTSYGEDLYFEIFPSDQTGPTIRPASEPS